jgi:hypothetical protein
MKLITVLMAMAAFSGTAWGDENVAVCVRDNAGVPVVIRTQGQEVAKHIFSTVGVIITWRCSRPADSSRLIVVKLAGAAPKDVKPGGLAYALPYEGAHITVFYDRLQRVADAPVTPSLLGHVLAHEIAHIIMGTDLHADSGVMKARWTRDDFRQMQIGLLPFTDEDISVFRVARELRRRADERCN